MARQPEVRYINAYVSGNTALQPEKKPQKKHTVVLPKAKRQQKWLIQVDAVAVGGILAAVVLCAMLLVSLVQMNRAKEEAIMYRDYAVALKAENQELKNTYSAGYDPDEIRSIATAMGMVPAEQVPHIQMQLQAPVTEQEPTAWESFWTFMVGLFA